MLKLPLIQVRVHTESKESCLKRFDSQPSPGKESLLRKVKRRNSLDRFTAKPVKPFITNRSQNDSKRLKEQITQEGKIKEKVWLIRTIGDLLGEGTKAINEKRLKMKKRLRGKYKKFQREADTLLNLINEEGNGADCNDHRKLKQALR